MVIDHCGPIRVLLEFIEAILIIEEGAMTVID